MTVMELNVVEIMKLIPHRYPFLLVDKIIESEGDTKVVGIKNVTINEPFFQGHFPGHPIMPGVLIVEAMAQLGGAFVRAKYDIGDDKVTYFVGIDNVKFRKPVIPGDVLRFELELVSTRR
jgi:3-hydroxyacyl-[acyl-carrier-protein] dehydratase